jgi:hypothetical protein
MKDPKDSDAKASGEDLTPPSSAKRSGRASFDDRGNAVWEWQLETGVYSRDVSTQKLKKLELDELSIAETAINKRPSGLGNDKPKPGGGFNPYDNSPQIGGGSSPYDNARNLGDKLRGKPAEQSRSPADMRRLSEAIKKNKDPGRR